MQDEQGNHFLEPGTTALDLKPFGTHSYAQEFFDAAVREHGLHGSRYSPVPYYLYCHSIELVLKAVLLAGNQPPKRVHQLTILLEDAKPILAAQGIEVQADWEVELGKAERYYGKSPKGNAPAYPKDGYAFTYFDTLTHLSAIGSFGTAEALPDIDRLRTIGETLLVRTEQFCLSAG